MDYIKKIYKIFRISTAIQGPLETIDLLEVSRHLIDLGIFVQSSVKTAVACRRDVLVRNGLYRITMSDTFNNWKTCIFQTQYVQLKFLIRFMIANTNSRYNFHIGVQCLESAV